PHGEHGQARARRLGPRHPAAHATSIVHCVLPVFLGCTGCDGAELTLPLTLGSVGHHNRGTPRARRSDWAYLNTSGGRMVRVSSNPWCAPAAHTRIRGSVGDAWRALQSLV